jgi:undecaprenyl-diphosphatase
MTVLEAVGLGILQGLTEFLPVSSSGHLALAHYFLGETEESLSFDVMLHLGTLAAVLFYFWADWKQVARSAVRLARHRRVQSDWDRLTLWLLLATIPAALAGKLLEDQAVTTFRSPWLVVVALATLGVLLLIAERVSERKLPMERLGLRGALTIGAAQALAIIPGVSRSGVTMTAGLFLGLTREAAARFSFLLSAPIIAGAGISQLPRLAGEQMEAGVLVGGFVAAVVSGFAAIWLLLRFIKTHSFAVFAYYRLALAGVVAVLLALGF